jgi:hypothetical protein
VCKLDSWAHILWAFGLTLKSDVTVCCQLEHGQDFSLFDLSILVLNFLYAAQDLFLPPKPFVSYSSVVSRSNFLFSQFGCQCCPYSSLLSVPKSCAGWVLPSHRLAVLHLVLLECSIRVFHFLLLSSEPALKFSLSPASDVCFLLVIFLLRFLLQVLISVLFLSHRIKGLSFPSSHCTFMVDSRARPQGVR